MQRFVIMMKHTESGAEAIERMPVWGDTLRTIWEELGGELDLLDVTMGDSDLIACGSFPSELAAMTFAASVTAGGVMTTKTIPAFPIDKFHDALRVGPKVHGTLTHEDPGS